MTNCEASNATIMLPTALLIFQNHALESWAAELFKMGRMPLLRLKQGRMQKK